MIILSFIFLALMFVGVFFYFRQNRPEVSNRYHKRKPIMREKVDFNVNTESNIDDALGLNSVEPADAAKSPALEKTSHAQSDCVIVLYLMATGESTYAGYELLQALLSSGMRFGAQRIFHRHAHKDGRGDVLFHCASATAPGTFDLSKMGAFSCKGLSLFFSASDVDEPLSTFDCLLETIDQLVEDLGGQVLDDKQALFTKEKMVMYRQQLRTFETRKTTVDMFA
ncbi:MAG: cell division protein ZipA [Gammaproteobacteria bacterium]|nr:cell division protein ZipA [Gammaproteobacteria bacterium]